MRLQSRYKFSADGIIQASAHRDGSPNLKPSLLQSPLGLLFYFKRGKSNAIAYLTNLLRVGSIAF